MIVLKENKYVLYCLYDREALILTTDLMESTVFLQPLLLLKSFI